MASIKSHILEKLKTQTRDEHLALETKLALRDQTLTLPQYVRVLEAWYGFYAPWELALDPWLVQVFADGASSRNKCHLLIQDLEWFGIAPAALPRCPYVPLYATLPAAMGGLYVMEGATLGGQIITRKVQSDLGAEARNRCRFFSSYGDRVGPMWREFQILLEDRISGETAEHEAVIAAADTFRAFRRWLGELGF